MIAAVAASPSVVDRIVDLSPVIATFCAGSLGILGVVVGQRIGQRSEADAWKRDRRLDHCTRCLSAAYGAWHAIVTLRNNRREAQKDSLVDQCNSRLTELGQSAAAVAILGPRELGDAATEMERTLTNLSSLVIGWVDLPVEDRAPLDLDEDGAEAHNGLSGFLTAARDLFA